MQFLHDSQIATIVGHGMKYRGRMMWWKTQNSFPAMKMNIWEDESGFMRTMPSAEKQLQYYLFATSAQSSKHDLLYFKVITEMISRILNLMASWEEIMSITYAYMTTSLIQHAQSLCCKEEVKLTPPIDEVKTTCTQDTNQLWQQREHNPPPPPGITKGELTQSRLGSNPQPSTQEAAGFLVYCWCDTV